MSPHRRHLRKLVIISIGHRVTLLSDTACKLRIYSGGAAKLFGRDEIDVPVLVDPPPVSDLFTFYLDTQDPGQRELDAQAAKILSATGQSSFSGTALLISFRYPKASIDAVGGDVATFRVSYQHGRPNELLGTLATPVIVGTVPPQATAKVQADVELTTATPVPLAINGFGGERSRGTLQSHGEFFAVLSATRLVTNLVRLRVRARRDIAATGRGFAEYRTRWTRRHTSSGFCFTADPATWSGFDLRHPKGTTNQRPILLSATNNLVLPPLPVGVTAAQLVVSRIVEPPANVPPGQVEPPSDWVYG